LELGDALLEEELNAAAEAPEPAGLRVLQAELDDLLQLDAPGVGQNVAMDVASEDMYNAYNVDNPQQHDVLMMDAEGVLDDVELVQPEMLIEEPRDVGEALALLGLGEYDANLDMLLAGDEAAAAAAAAAAAPEGVADAEVAPAQADDVILEEEGEEFDGDGPDDERERDAEVEELACMPEGGPEQYPHPETVPPNQQVAAYRAYLDEPLYAGCEMTLREYANHIIVDLKLRARMSDRCIKRVLRIQRSKLVTKPNLVPPSFHVVIISWAG
jgi:hypothetical protein